MNSKNLYNGITTRAIKPLLLLLADLSPALGAVLSGGGGAWKMEGGGLRFGGVGWVEGSVGR